MNQRERNTMRQVWCRDRIMELLHMSQDKYYAIQFELAEEFLMNHFLGVLPVVKQYMADASFWSWWRNQYQIIDEEFFRLVSKDNDRYKLIESYREVHLITDFRTYPDRVVANRVNQTENNDTT